MNFFHLSLLLFCLLPRFSFYSFKINSARLLFREIRKQLIKFQS
jgi:hypothetical protein